MSLEDFFFQFKTRLCLLFLTHLLMSGYVMKARLVPSFGKKNHVTRLLNSHGFFSQNHCLQKVLKWSPQLHVKGLAGVWQIMEENPLPHLPSIFNLALDKLYHQHKNMAVLQSIGLEKYENVRTAWVADWIRIYDFLDQHP